MNRLQAKKTRIVLVHPFAIWIAFTLMFLSIFLIGFLKGSK